MVELFKFVVLQLVLLLISRENRQAGGAYTFSGFLVPNFACGYVGYQTCILEFLIVQRSKFDVL